MSRIKIAAGPVGQRPENLGHVEDVEVSYDDGEGTITGPGCRDLIGLLGDDFMNTKFVIVVDGVGLSNCLIGRHTSSAVDVLHFDYEETFEP